MTDAIANLRVVMTNVILSGIVEKNNTLKKIWDTFNKLYEVKSLLIRMFLKRKIYNFQ